MHVNQVMRPRKLTDTSSTVVWDRQETPLGDEFQTTGSLTQNLRFPGQYEDSETSFYQNWHRDYDAELGRYIQSDPIGLLGGINTYAYVEGNPVSQVDPDGLNPLLAFRAGRASAAVGSAVGRAIAPSIARAMVRAGLKKGYQIGSNGQIIAAGAAGAGTTAYLTGDDLIEDFTELFKSVAKPANDNTPRGFCTLVRELDPDPDGTMCLNKTCQYKCKDGYTFTQEQAARNFSCPAMALDPRGF